MKYLLFLFFLFSGCSLIPNFKKNDCFLYKGSRYIVVEVYKYGYDVKEHYRSNLDYFSFQENGYMTKSDCPKDLR